MCSDCSKHINYKRYIHSYKVEKLVTYVREKKSNFLPSGPGQLIPARQTQEEIMVAQDFLEHFNWHDSEGLGCLITGVRGAGEASGWPQSAAPSRELGVLLLLWRPPWAQVRPGGRASPRLACPAGQHRLAACVDGQRPHYPRCIPWAPWKGRAGRMAAINYGRSRGRNTWPLILAPDQRLGFKSEPQRTYKQNCKWLIIIVSINAL